MSRHSGLINVLLLVAALLVTVVVLEGGSRLFYLVRWGGRLYPIHEVHYSLRLGWELAPGAYVNYRINGQGFRRPEDVAVKRPAGVVRIFLVGGSTAFGFNGLYPSIPSKKLEYQDTIDYHLQTLLERRHPDRRFEVINAAVTEYRLFQEITLFREKLVNYEPNLVIFMDGHNDASTLMGGAALRQEPAPYWNVRHFARGQRVLNPSPIVGPLYYADLYLGRVSYFYHGLAILFQRLHDVAPEAAGAAGPNAETGGRFRLEDEQRLLERAGRRLQDLESALPMYVDEVRDLKALGAARGVKLVYALQPEIVAEDRAKLTPIEVQIQDLTFRVLEAYGGTLSWRYMTRRIPSVLAELDAPTFRVVNLVTIADGTGEQLYTDYTHLTSRGNRKVAERLYPVVAELLDLEEARRSGRERSTRPRSRGAADDRVGHEELGVISTRWAAAPSGRRNLRRRAADGRLQLSGLVDVRAQVVQRFQAARFSVQGVARVSARRKTARILRSFGGVAIGLEPEPAFPSSQRLSGAALNAKVFL